MSHESMDRRRFLKGVTVAGTASMLGLAGCIGGADENEDYPSEEIQFIVPFAAGGGFDEIARLAEPYWEEYLPGDDVEMTVENITGGGSSVGTAQAYSADSDGHTMLFGDPFSAGSQQIVRDTEYDLEDLSYIGHFSHEPHGIAAMESTNLDGWDDFVDRIDEFNFATQGAGSVAHTAPLLLAEITGEFDIDDLNFVHYTGTGEAMGGLEKGETDIYMVGSASSALVARAIDNCEHFLMFTDPETGEPFSDITENWATDFDIPNIEEYIDVSSFQRFVAGPPEVPDEILETQREAMGNIINDDEFIQSGVEVDRHIFNSVADETAREVTMRKLDFLRQDPWPDLLEDMLGS